MQDMTSLSLQGGTVVNADLQQEADVLIKDGLITAVSPSIKVGSSSPTAACMPSGKRIQAVPEIVCLCANAGSKRRQNHRCER